MPPYDSRACFLVDLMEFPFYSFHVIIGMDWLTKNKEKVDFEMNRITLGDSEALEIVVVGGRPEFLSNVV